MGAGHPRDYTKLSFALTTIFYGLIAAAQQPPDHYFTNPLFRGGDPWLVHEDGYYIYSSADCPPYRDAICLKRSPTLAGIIDAPTETVWRPRDGHDPNGTEIWAPEIRKLDGHWYIYYAADPKHNNNRHRIFVLRANAADPLGGYSEANTGAPHGALQGTNTHWAIDPDVFTAADNQLYIAWSCTNFTNSRFPQRVCLARMRDPEHLATAPVPIATPTERWERRGAPIQEGPVGYARNGITYITYSASASWISNDYAVGILQNTGRNLLNAASWSKSGPIFDHHGRTYGPGSVVFIPNSDGTEYWNFYHAIDSTTCSPAYDCRDIRMQRMWFTSAGFPVLGFPVDPGVRLEDAGAAGDSILAPDWGKAWGDAAEGLSTGQIIGQWTWSGPSTVSISSPQAGWNQIFRVMNPNSATIRVHAEAQLAHSAGTNTAAVYGVYCLYDDANNHAELLIDAGRRALLTRAVVRGKQQREHATPLPTNFDFSRSHVLECDKSNNIFDFRLDPLTPNAIELKRRFALRSGQMGVLVAGANVEFRNVRVE